MKKIISVMLSILLIFGMFAMPASAATENKHVKCPIIFIAGSSVDICDADGNIISTGFDVLTDDDEGDTTKEQIIESVIKILLPFVAEGLPFDKWDNYSEALYEELAPIWDETQLDGNGNAKYGTGVSKAEIAQWDNNALVNHGKDGTFNFNDYKFRYDWRLSPYDHVDRLHEYIKTIIKTTGCAQVALVGRCLGGNVVTAYLDKYGDKGLVKKVVYDEVMSNGSAPVNDVFSGKIEFNDKLVQAYLLESEYYGKENIGIDLAGVSDMLLDIVKRLLDVLTQLGVAESVYGGVEALYEKVATAFMPAILRATGIGTWVSYWSSVYDENFDTALDLIFGAEGTQTREANEGLIDKITEVRERIVKTRTLEGEENLYKKFANKYGVEIGVVAGYGLVNIPITESANENGDCTVDTKNSSFGATVAGVFDTLPQQYIDERVAAGYGEYISPDGKVDASTCLFPETTWIIKNKHHDTMSGVYYITEKFTQYEGFTADSNYKDISRFIVTTGNGTMDFENMTADNCSDGEWLTKIEQKPTEETKIKSFYDFLVSFFKMIADFFKNLFKI